MKHLRETGQARRRAVARTFYYVGWYKLALLDVERADRFASEHDIDLGRSYFYTDSITDLPLLERVGEPRVVNPDPRLGRVAARRGWPVVRLRLGDTAAVFETPEGARQAVGS